jgi:beta-xylosidase
MKLNIDGTRSQGDPYVIKANGAYYMYATHADGVQLYKSLDKFNWEYLGFCFVKEGEKEYWAPAVTEVDGKFYLYYSAMLNDSDDVHTQRICVAVSDSPEGKFAFVKELLAPFSIDAHVVESGGQLYMYYSVNDDKAERAGTLIVVEKMLTPTEMAGNPKIAVRATLYEEIFMCDRFKKGQHWHTLEGAFYFEKDGWHYLMYSGNCYQNEKYYIGYAVAKSDEKDLTKLTFKKYPNEDTYCPLLCKNEFEEGTGHHSVVEEDGRYYLFYHGREKGVNTQTDKDTRTARLCEIIAKDGVLEVVKR